MGAPSAATQVSQTGSSGKGNQSSSMNANLPASSGNTGSLSTVSSEPLSTPSGKTGIQGAQGTVTTPSQGGQPVMGQPNSYSNTVGTWDNASIQPKSPSGKGKGA